jgi:hypothetical protein
MKFEVIIIPITDRVMMVPMRIINHENFLNDNAKKITAIKARPIFIPHIGTMKAIIASTNAIVILNKT